MKTRFNVLPYRRDDVPVREEMRRHRLKQLSGFSIELFRQDITRRNSHKRLDWLSRPTGGITGLVSSMQKHFVVIIAFLAISAEGCMDGQAPPSNAFDAAVRSHLREMEYRTRIAVRQQFRSMLAESESEGGRTHFVDSMARLADDTDPAMRRAIAMALVEGVRDSDNAIPALERLAADSDPEVRKEALESLRTLAIDGGLPGP